MAGTWERRGTVTVTQDSNVVIGAGTVWTDAQNGPQVGNTFYGPDGKAHEVAVIRSATELWLADEYKGATAAGATYQIDTTRVDSVPGLASRVAAVLGFAQGQYDNLDKWTQGGVDEDVTLTSPNGESVTVPSLPKMGKDYNAIGDALPAAIRAETASADVTVKHGEVVVLAAQAASDADTAQTAKNTAVAAADTATQKAADAAASEASAAASATKAENAANIVVGALIDAGPYNASSGVLPTPVMSGLVKLSSVWKVTVGGIAGGIELGVGDSLVYTSREDSYYKIDNTESVTSVNGEKGIVTLNAEKVGADASGTAANLVSQHSAKNGAHPISGITGLADELSSKFSKTNKPSAADVTGLIGPISSGSVIESGSNSNGNYVKFADGTMVCYGQSASALVCNISANAGLFTSPEVTLTMPATFVGVPSYNCGCKSTSKAAGFMWSAEAQTTETFVTMRLITTSSASPSAYASFTATGKWK